MDQSLRKCSVSVSAGFAGIRAFDRVLLAGDLDQAADQLTKLWNKLYEPAQTLTNWQDGEFWRDWPGRSAFEDNLKKVYEILNTVEDDCTIEALEEVRDYLVANFSLLTDAIVLLGADLGGTNLGELRLESVV
jgi:hypothetical protein